jgi:hypothetical protein
MTHFGYRDHDAPSTERVQLVFAYRTKDVAKPGSDKGPIPRHHVNPREKEEGAVMDAEHMAGSLLAPMFIRGGWDAFQNPESKVKAAEAVTRAVSERLSFVPDDPAVLVRLNGAVQVGAGAHLATGPFRRVAALLLIGSLIPTPMRAMPSGRRWTSKRGRSNKSNS